MNRDSANRLQRRPRRAVPRLFNRHLRAAGAVTFTALLIAAAGPIQGAAEPAMSTRSREEGPITWVNLRARLDAAAREGFKGTILVARNGEILLHEGYGMANEAAGIPNRPDTIYAIGSTPIDFTKAGILLLAQQGKLSLADKITAYLKNVPPDKQGITLDHLMTGRSGLRDFHGRPSDGNPDHFHIDRDEAMRRILEGKLLFKPGEGRRHSHSAWGILAAVIEIVSGESYPEFTRKRLFEPAGMVDTGFFGEPYDKERMAVGYGDDSNGEINAPPYWGPTSWLVMGSGGQISTTMDIFRWHRALAAGKILQGEYLEDYWSGPGALLGGGDQFGFEFMATEDPDTKMIMMSNHMTQDGMQAFQDLGRSLAGLVNSGSMPPFTLGVQIEIRGPGQVFLQAVLEGGAAHRDGLRSGDRILTIGGQNFGDDPMELLDPYLKSGKPIPFGVQRGAEKLEIVVKPDPR